MGVREVLGDVELLAKVGRPKDGGLIGLRELAREVGVSPATVAGWRKAGVLPGTTGGMTARRILSERAGEAPAPSRSNGAAGGARPVRPEYIEAATIEAELEDRLRKRADRVSAEVRRDSLIVDMGAKTKTLIPVEAFHQLSARFGAMLLNRLERRVISVGAILSDYEDRAAVVAELEKLHEADHAEFERLIHECFRLEGIDK